MSQEPIDPILRILVNLLDGMNGPDDRMSITLTVEGMLISGDLISASRWVREVAAQPGNEGLEPMFRQHREKIDEAQNAEKAAWESQEEGNLGALKVHDEKYPPSQFIHLRESEFYGSGEQGMPLRTANGIYWRGRLSAVSGWSTGKLESPAQH